jgi:D-alanine-D-alanine ligase
MSQRSSDAILEVLSKHYAEVGVTIVNDLADLEALIELQPDLVFLGMKFVPANPVLGRQSPRIWLAQRLDAAGISYTGSSHEAHQLDLDKPSAKQRALDLELNTPPYYVVKQGQQLTEADMELAFPVFIKPTDRGGGLGIDGDSVARNFQELETKVGTIAAEQQADSLVEQYLPGREFSVAILQDTDSASLAVMPIELLAPPDARGLKLLSKTVKTSNGEQAVMVTDGLVRAKIIELAMAVFEALGARDYGRIDLRLDNNGVPHFLEANLIPSLIGGYGSFPKACRLNIDLAYEPMIVHIAQLGLARHSSSVRNPHLGHLLAGIGQDIGIVVVAQPDLS